MTAGHRHMACDDNTLKDSQKLNDKKTKNSIKLGKRTDTSYRKIYGSKPYEHILSQMQFITGMQFTIMLRYYDIPLRMLEMKNTGHIP